MDTQDASLHATVMSLLQTPPFSVLANSQHVLTAGASGGFDLYCGIPLALALRDAGKDVVLANLTFAYLGGTDALPGAIEVW
jgi:hypothetical protein